MLRKIINTFGTKMLSALLNFAIAAVVSQAVGDVGKGEQTLVLTTVAFILIFSEIVSGGSLVYLASRHPFSKLILPSYLWSLLVGLVAAGTVPLFYHGLPTDVVLHICVLAVLASASSVNSSILVGHERVPASNYLNLWQPVAILGMLCLCYFGFGMLDIHAYLLALYVAYGGSWLIGILMLLKEFRGFRLHPLREYSDVLRDLFQYGFLNQTSHFVQFFNLRLSYYLLDTFVDTGSTGVFSNAVSLAEAVWIISRSIALVQYARIANAGDGDYARRLTLDLLKACFAISLVAMLVLACFPSGFYRWLFGPEFGAVAPLIRILIPGTLLYSVFLIIGHYYSGIGKYQMNTYAALCGLIFTFACGFTLIPAYDVYGAAVTTSAAYAANAVFVLAFFLKRSGFRLRQCLITLADIRGYRRQAGVFLQELLHKK